MKVRRQKSVFFRGLVLVVAFALSILCFPINGLVALAVDGEYVENFDILTIDNVNGEDSRVVTKGATYSIPEAQIDGNSNWVIGDETKNGQTMDQASGSVTLESTEVRVTYNGAKVTSSTDDGYDGTFVAENEGTYVVTYSYQYTIDGKTYTNSYDLEVVSTVSSATINFSDNEENIMPSILDLSLAKDGESYKDMFLALPEIKDEDGDEVEDVAFYTSQPEVQTGNYVVMTLRGGVNGNSHNITTEVDAESQPTGRFFVNGDVFKEAGAGNYTITYSYYVDGNFVVSSTKTVRVYAEQDNPEDNYYQNYSLQLELASDWTDNGETGVENTLPAAVGVTSSNTTPANESVDVYYEVEVLFTSNRSESGFASLDPNLYNTDPKNPVLREETVDGATHYYLVDPTSFKPLQDGYYRFIYTITDFYGNSKSSTAGSYEYTNITDNTNPTPVIYDASVREAVEDLESDETVPTYEDATSKLKTRAYANGVVIYAIGMEDNVSNVNDDDISLTRTIMTDETVTRLTISGYDEYNLVFNYSDTGSSSAWQALKTNNYLINRGATSVGSDDAMRQWLKENYYLIVIDNANAQSIYDLFASAGIFDSSITNGETLISWLRDQSEDTIAELGFAYLDVDQTFGATSANSGMGTGQYYVHYIAEDAAGNETDTYRGLRIVNEIDSEIPEITFSTTLQSLYTPNSTVTFNVPTASDNFDNSMSIVTMYRYLDNDGTPIDVSNNDGKISTENLTQLWADLNSHSNALQNGRPLTEVYDAYHEGDEDGYINLTDASASTYSIDVSEAGVEARSLQIVVFVYDDAGNVNMYGQTVQISNANDQYAPQFISLSETRTEYDQGAEIELPTMVVRDDAVSYMSFNLKVTYTDNDGTVVNINPTGYYAERRVGSNGMGEYTVHGGSFVASYANGDYQLSISVADSRGNTIVAFVNYDVNPRTVIQPPVINTNLDFSEPLELDDYGLNDTIEIPVPTVSYEIAKSVTYDEYTSNSEEYDDNDDYQYVIYGVDSDNRPYDYTTTFGQVGSLKPRELGVGEYDLIYTVSLKVYNFKYFTYNEWGYDEGVYTEGGFFTYSNADTNPEETASVWIEGDKFKVKVTPDQFYYVMRNDQGVVGIYEEDEGGYTPVDELTYASTILGDPDLALDDWFTELREYNLTSETYHITIQDTQGPTIADFTDRYPVSLSTEELEENRTLTIYGIQASDASGIDLSRSSISLSFRLASGSASPREWTGEDAGQNQTYEIQSNVMDGTYTITYTVYDNAGNYSTSTYSIAVGDNVAPTMTFPTEYVDETYTIGSTLTIDLSEIRVTDNNALPDGTLPTVTLTSNNGSTTTTIEEDESSTDTVKVYNLDEIGTYTLTFTVEDAVGQETTETITFEVSERTTDTTMIYQIVGTVLIVVAVLVLAGVIIYFIVSKVKLDKEMKK